MVENFSVFSLNLRFGLADDGPNGWPERKAMYPTLLGKYRSDFMCFQEANDFQIDFLQSILPEYEVIGQRKPAPEFWQNNIIFFHSRWTCIEKQHFFLSHTPDIPSRFKESRWPRQCTIGVFKSDNQQLICVNTHLDFDSAIQDKSATLIMERLSKWPQTIPAILTGDFNAVPSDECYATFTHEKGCKTGHTASPFRDSFSDPFPGTHHEFTGISNGDHIDWILFKGGITVKNAQVVKDDFNGRYPSDHFPVRTVFAFQ